MRSIEKFLKGFLLGGIVGCLIALMLAPASGSETRVKIKDNIYYVKNEVESAAKARSAELKEELARLQKRV